MRTKGDVTDPAFRRKRARKAANTMHTPRRRAMRLVDMSEEFSERDLREIGAILAPLVQRALTVDWED